MGSVLECAAVSPAARQHPTEKPVALLSAIIEAIPSVAICDPFMGIGTTGVAAVRAGRRFVGCEITAQHFDLAVSRINAALAAKRQELPLGETA